ncbi:MAG TPA: PadR family transcriptional regulator [Vicinamibacterales bacterium]|jgi:transcriptional regulator
MGKPTDLVQGTLDFLILKTIALEPKHGWAIAKRIQQISEDVLQVPQGSLYPALYRLERQGWITGTPGEAESGRRVKFYRLTKAGRAHLERELESWKRLSTAINLVIRATSAEG